MSVAANAAMAAAMANAPYDLVTAALVGKPVAGPADQSSLAGLLVAGERAEFATEGEAGAALFTNARVIVAQRVGVLTKRLAVKAFPRGAIVAYSIDPDTLVTIELLGGFGKATLIFDTGFDPMLLSQWLGETLVPGPNTN